MAAGEAPAAVAGDAAGEALADAATGDVAGEAEALLAVEAAGDAAADAAAGEAALAAADGLVAVAEAAGGANVLLGGVAEPLQALRISALPIAATPTSRSCRVGKNRRLWCCI
jgi:hypothetical protein